MQTVSFLNQRDWLPIIENLSVIRLSVMDDAVMTRFQVEDGTERGDHIIYNAIEISIDAEIDKIQRETFEEIELAFRNQTLLTIQTKLRNYENMIITAIPHSEDSSESFVFPIRLQEWRQVEPAYGALPPRSVANQANSSTVDRGQVRGSPTTAEEADGVKTKAKRQSILAKHLL